MNDRIKFSGHTMGAPKCDIFEVINFSRASVTTASKSVLRRTVRSTVRSLRMRRRARSMPQPGQREWSFPA